MIGLIHDHLPLADDKKETSLASFDLPGRPSETNLKSLPQ